MKSYLIVFAILIGCSYGQAQSKVHASDLKGKWKMVFDIDETDIEEELEDEDVPWIGRLFAKSVTSLVFGILDEIDVEMHFLNQNRLKIVINAFGEREVEYGKWYIDRHGALILDDHRWDQDRHHHDNDIWLMKNRQLVAYEQQGKKLDRQPVYLVRID